MTSVPVQFKIMALPKQCWEAGQTWMFLIAHSVSIEDEAGVVEV